jgi:hypothetical protein
LKRQPRRSAIALAKFKDERDIHVVPEANTEL